MASMIKQCSQSCADQTSPCGSPCGLYCEVKDLGYVSICGIPAYDDSGRCFETETISGGWTLCGYNDLSSCDPGNFYPTFSEKHVWSGTRTWNVDSCSEATNDQLDSIYKSMADCGDAGTLHSTFGPIDPSGPGTSQTTAATSDTYEGDGDCQFGVFPGSREIHGTAVKSLSDEVYVSDLITARLAAAEWSSGGCSAIWSEAAPLLAGGTVIYRDSRWQILQNGMIPFHLYSFDVEYWRRTVTFNETTHDWDYGDWTLYSTMTASGTTDGAGDLATTFTTIPNAQGYETMVVVPACTGLVLPGP